jgi:hypothetical protein
MSDLELTDIDGIGPARAETLTDANYTVRTLASVDAETIESDTDFNLNVAETLVENAADAYFDVDGDGSAEENASEGSEESGEGGSDDGENVETDDGGSDQEMADSPLTYDVTPYVDPDDSVVGDDMELLDLEMDAKLLQHIIHVQLEEATKKKQSNEFGLQDDAYSVARKLMAVSVTESDPVDSTVALSQPEVVSLFRATSQGYAEYASRSGISGMWAKIENFSDTVNEIRE